MVYIPIHSKLLPLIMTNGPAYFKLELEFLCNNGQDFLKCSILPQRKQDPRPWTIGIDLPELEEDCWLGGELLSQAAELSCNWALEHQSFLRDSLFFLLQQPYTYCPLASLLWTVYSRHPNFLINFFNFPPAYPPRTPLPLPNHILNGQIRILIAFCLLCGYNEILTFLKWLSGPLYRQRSSDDRGSLTLSQSFYGLHKANNRSLFSV